MKDDFVIMGFHFHIARFESNFKGKRYRVSRMVNDPQQAICPAWERFLLQFDSWSIIRFCLAANLSSSPEHPVGLSECPMEEKSPNLLLHTFLISQKLLNKGGLAGACQMLLYRSVVRVCSALWVSPPEVPVRSPPAGDQPQLIQGTRRRDGLGDSLYANQRCQE